MHSPKQIQFVPTGNIPAGEVTWTYCGPDEPLAFKPSKLAGKPPVIIRQVRVYPYSDLHGYSVGIAKIHGLTSAIVYQHVYARCRGSESSSVRITIDSIAEKHSYLGKKQVFIAMRRLVKSGLLVRVKNSGGGFRYRLKFNTKQTKLTVFSAGMAIKYGVMPAVIHHDMHQRIQHYAYLPHAVYDYYWQCHCLGMEDVSGDTIRKLHGQAACEMSANMWAKEHEYVSSTTINRGFKRLASDGLLVKDISTGILPVWSLPKEDKPEPAKQRRIINFDNVSDPSNN